MYVALDPIGSSSKKKNNKNSQIIKTTQTTPQVDPLVAIEEEKRRKRVQENRMLMNGVKKVSSEISESYDELRASEKVLDKGITGEFANRLKSMLHNAQGEIEKVVNDLNVIGTKAAQNVKKEGEPCEYDKQQLNSEPSYNGNGKTTFSCNTDVVLKQVLPRLQDGIKKLAKTTTTTSNLPRLEGCEDVTNIPNRLEGITKSLKNSLTGIEKLLERAEQAEEETKKIGEQLMEKNIDAITVALRIKPTGLLNSAIKNFFEGMEKASEKITTQGIPIWKDGVEYTFRSNKANVNGVKYTYYIMEPKNPDLNIPTLFCLDGDGVSRLAGVSGEYMEYLATTYSEHPYSEQKSSPLAAINQSGLDKPNIRFVYLPNPSNRFKACAMTSEQFYKIVDEIVEQNDNKIDINNMSILGHSARRKSCCTVCEWYRYGRSRT